MTFIIAICFSQSEISVDAYQSRKNLQLKITYRISSTCVIFHEMDNLFMNL
jgi:hypothetical protein